jgi:hypothetical protein
MNTCKAIRTIDANYSLTRNCPFGVGYADGTVSNGTISTETVKLGDKVLPDIVFGCGFNNDGILRPT